MVNDGLQPIRKMIRCGYRSQNIAKFQMRMGIDQARDNTIASDRNLRWKFRVAWNVKPDDSIALG